MTPRIVKKWALGLVLLVMSVSTCNARYDEHLHEGWFRLFDAAMHGVAVTLFVVLAIQLMIELNKKDETDDD